MTALEPLCEFCMGVKLDPKYLSWGDLSEDVLGPASWIKSSSCPLCLLVKGVLYEEQRMALDLVPRFFWDERRVTLRWAGMLGPGERGIFKVNDGSQASICFSGRRGANSIVHDACFLRQEVPRELEIRRVLGWLSACTTSHTDCKIEESTTFERAFPGLRVLRLIDVMQNCLIETRDLCEYAALSYVWGDVPNFKLNRANKRELLVPGSVEKVWKILPRTIRDAIELTRRLGLVYLWVDTLCLSQNDADDLDLGVAVMDQIFERAWLTIIAACGHNAHAGLPGVREGSRKALESPVEVKKGIWLGMYTELDLLLRHSVYNSRAWTFQEHLLSRRALYFVDDKVFFRCREAEYTELCFDHGQHRRIETRRTESNRSLADCAYMLRPLPDFSTMLLYFTQRALTNQDDILRAMSGIMRRVSEKGGFAFFQGLPTAAFDAFILFIASRGSLHRRSGFPSYSWAGWKGNIMLDVRQLRSVSPRLVTSVWIDWHKRTTSGKPAPVWNCLLNDKFASYSLEHVGYGKRRPFQAPNTLRVATSRTAPTENLCFNPPPLKYPLLQFWTLSVFYKIGNFKVFEGRADVLTEREACGEITLDGFEETLFFDSGGIFEFILLSEWSSNIWIADSAKQPPRYNIMLLEWHGGVAERRGIGFIEQSAVDQSFPPGPTWKEILLA